MFGYLSTTMIMSEVTFERRERCPPEWLSAVVAAVGVSTRGIVRSQ